MYTMTPRCQLRAPPPPRAATTTPPAPSFTTPSRADPDELRSTWQHRAWTLAGATAVLSSVTTSATTTSPTSIAEPLAASLLAYTLADLATGVYHWLIDNYGSPTTPLLGPQIAAFQGHHAHPSTITRRDFSNNLHSLARAVAFLLPPIDAALAAFTPDAASAHAFVGVFAASVAMSQQFHAWAHENPRRLPAGVAALQRAGVLVSRAAHAAHHREPYDCNYCIVSGVWNPVLDRYRVFLALEMVVFFRTGVRPRSWDQPDAAWTEVHAGDADGDGESE
uniref:Lipid desaturase domain-containing protein n=1 Tax=Leersia perrieri TaxID=77586 RepID=A0A0D9X554_9ORYZ